MRLRVSLVTLGLLSMAPPLPAQHNCPEGFNFAGTLHGTGSYGIAFDERREVTLPLYATIDTSFQQSNVRARAGNSKAKSDLQAKDIPKGIYILTGGSTHYDNGWAVSAPELKTVGEPPRYRFGMKLYCISSSNSPNAQFGGCDVNVDVCYKPKK
jgi:hypothetical protein